MNTGDRSGHMSYVMLPLYGLSCSSGDALIVERILAQQPGVIGIYANPNTEKAYIEYDPALIDRDRLQDVIQYAGYGPLSSRGRKR